jgi:hypothetical protein
MTSAIDLKVRKDGKDGKDEKVYGKARGVWV